jgi:putative ABC transport system permease protein
MFQYALHLVFRRKLRTFLTSLGIAVAVILMSFIVFGMKDLERIVLESLNEQFDPKYVTVINVNIPAFSASNIEFEEEQKQEERTILTSKVVREFEEYDKISEVYPVVRLSGFEMMVDSQKEFLNPAFIEAWDIQSDDEMLKGYTGKKGSLASGEAFVTKNFLEKAELSEDDVIGSDVTIRQAETSAFGTNKSKGTEKKEYTFEVVGVVDSGAKELNLMLSTEDGLTVLSEEGGFDNKDDYLANVGYDGMRITAKNEGDVADIKTWIEDNYNVGQIFTLKDILGFIDQVLGAFLIALVVLGAVSAVVASVGIVNTMVMSIYEQTKEIGIIKALGASNRQVFWIFVIQSGAIGFIGSVLGLAVVFAGMKIGDPYVVKAFENSGFVIDRFFSYDLGITAYIVLASIVVGILAGIYPAIRASMLDPIKAIRS